MLPYTKVYYQFGAGRVSGPNVRYTGAVLGRARRLHDIVSKGYFDPDVKDTSNSEWGTFSASSLDRLLEAWDYPDFKDGNTIDPETVKVYLNNLEYVSSRFAKSGSDLGAPIAVPQSDGGVLIGQEADEPLSLSPFVEISIDDGVLTINPKKGDSALENQLPGGVRVVPGTIKIKIDFDTHDSLYITDTPIDENIMAIAVGATDFTASSTSPITGEFYVGILGEGTHPVTGVTSNTLKINYEEGTVSGSIVLVSADPEPTLEGSPEVHLLPMVLSPLEALVNLAQGDTFIFGRRTGTDTPNGVSYVINAGSTHAVYSYDGTEGLNLATVRTNYESFPDSMDNDQALRKDILSIDYDNAKVYFSGNQDWDSLNVDYTPFYETYHIAKETRPRRLVKDTQYSIVETGDPSLIGQLTILFSSMVINTRVRDKGTYLLAYDHDPLDYANIVPEVTFVNFISGNLLIEYEEIVTSEAVVNHPFDLQDIAATDDEELINRIGQWDPRNQLGFAIGFTRKLTTLSFFIVPYTTLSGALTEVEKIRRIFWVWNVDTQPNVGFSTWLTQEADPKRSRARHGFEAQTIPDKLTKIFWSQEVSGDLAINIANSQRTFTSSGVNFVTSGVTPGDQFYFEGDETPLTVSFVRPNELRFSERYSRNRDLALNTAEILSDGSIAEFDFMDPIKSPAHADIYVRVVYQQDEGVPQQFEGTLAQALAQDFCSAVGVTGTVVTMEANTGDDYIFISVHMAAVPDDRSGICMIERKLNPTEKTDWALTRQTQANPDYTVTLTSKIQTLKEGDRFGYLPEYAVPGIIFASKLTLLPHMPLSLVSFNTLDSSYSLGMVEGFQDFNKDDHIEALAAAGYLVLNSPVNGQPFCESDNTTGYKLFKETDRGLLSKIVCVRLYGRDTYEVTRKFKGPYNTDNPELLTLINVHLEALRERYIGRSYPLLGTLLKSVANQTVTFDGPFTHITHRISSQDPSRYVENLIIVE